MPNWVTVRPPQDNYDPDTSDGGRWRTVSKPVQPTLPEPQNQPSLLRKAGGLVKEFGKDIVGTTAAVGADLGNVLTPWDQSKTQSVRLFGKDYITPSARGAKAGQLASQGLYKQAIGELGTAGLDVLSTFATPFKGLKAFKAGTAARGFVQAGTAAAPITAAYGAAGAAAEGESGLDIAKSALTGGAVGFVAGGVLGAGLAKLGSVFKGKKIEVEPEEAGKIVDEVDELIGRATTPVEEEAILEAVSRGVSREKIIEEAAKTSGSASKLTKVASELSDDDNVFLKKVEERFAASKREKFREATQDEKGRFTGSTKGEKTTLDGEKDDLSRSIENRIQNIKGEGINEFSYREDLRRVQEKVVNAKKADLPGLKAEAEAIAQRVLDERAAKVRPEIQKEIKQSYLQSIANDSESPREFMLNMRRLKLDPQKEFKSLPELEKFYKTQNAGKYRVAEEDPLTQEARKYGSAEEFVKAKTDLYHGSIGGDFEKFDPAKFSSGIGTDYFGKGAYLTDNFSSAKDYAYKDYSAVIPFGKGSAKIFDAEKKISFEEVSKILDNLPKGTKIDTKTIREVARVEPTSLHTIKRFIKSSPGLGEDIATALKKLGYDGVSFNARPDGIGGRYLTIYNTDKLHTKSQLTDIWNKAHGGKNRLADDFERIAGKKITPEQEEEIIKLNKKLFGDDAVEITAQLMTPNGKRAFGEYKNKMIKIVGGQADPKDTYFHEAVHKYLDIFTTLDEQKKIYLEARKLWKTDDLDELEEQIAEHFIRYAKENEGVVGTMKVLFDNVIKRIKAAFEGTSDIENLYKDILTGKAKKSTETPAPNGKSKLAQGVRAKAIKEKIIYGFDRRFRDLPEYDKVSIKEQAEKATNLVVDDFEKALRIAFGEEKPPEGLLPESVFNAVEEYATLEKDIDLLRKLANSSLSLEATEMGQRLRILAERNPDSAISNMQGVQKERVQRFEEESGKKVKEAQKETVESIKKAIKQPVPTKADWESFVESIKC